MLRHADDVLGLDLDAIVAGPGLGTSEHAATLVGAVLASEMPCVLDADALNLLSEERICQGQPARAAPRTRCSRRIRRRRRACSERAWRKCKPTASPPRKRLARSFSAHVVLKGNGSVVAARDGHWFINTSGNPGMASAGMGDVLAGILGALLAQRYTGETALVLGVHLHGAAADALVRSGSGPVGLTAGELIEPARRLWNQWLSND